MMYTIIKKITTNTPLHGTQFDIELHGQSVSTYFFCQGGGKGGLGWSAAVATCSHTLPPLTKEKQKTMRARSFSLFFSFVGGRVRLHVGYRSCPCWSQLCESFIKVGVSIFLRDKYSVKFQ